MDLLKVENVCKSYGSKQVLHNVSLSVEKGTVYGLLGPNGAGKTTLIRIINHITAPDSGTVIFDGHTLCEADTAQIGYLPEERGLYKKMKVGEQAMFFARLKGLSSRKAETALREWFEKFEITSWWNRKVEELSKGMAQKIQFIVTVLHKPKLLIFDEPFSGFDPINAELIRNEILQLRDSGMTVIFSTHNMASVEEICQNITLINHGRNILSGNVEELRRQFSKDCYILKFKGDTRTFLEPLLPLLQSNTIESEGELTTAHLHVNPGVELRQVIETANNAVDLRFVSEEIASMNDIFISTVKSYNQNAEQ